MTDFQYDSGETDFWRETGSMRGGIEAIHNDMAPSRRMHVSRASFVRAARCSHRASLRIGLTRSLNLFY